MSLYIPPSREHPVRQVFVRTPNPRPEAIAHLVHFEETEESPEYWTVRLYRDNFDFLDAEDKVVVFNWVNDILAKMRVFEPRCYVEVHERVPR